MCTRCEIKQLESKKIWKEVTSGKAAVTMGRVRGRWVERGGKFRGRRLLDGWRRVRGDMRKAAIMKKRRRGNKTEDWP